MKTYIKN